MKDIVDQKKLEAILLKSCENGVNNEKKDVESAEEKVDFSKLNIPGQSFEIEPRFSVFKGIVFSTLSAICFSFCSIIVKYLDDISPSELAIFRYSGIFLLSIPNVVINRLNPFGPRDLRLILIFRGAVGGLSLMFRFYCLQYLPIAEASIIVSSFPVMTAIFAKIFLKVNK